MPVAVEYSDDFTGADGAAWSGLWTVRNVLGTGSTATIHSNQGRMRTDPAATGDRFIIASPPGLFTNFDMRIKFAAVDVATLGGFPEIGYRITTGMTSGTPGNGYAISLAFGPIGGPANDGSITIYTLPARDYFARAQDQPIDNLSQWWYRVRVKGNRHLVKWWPVGGDEPPGWKIDAVDSTYTAPGAIYIGTYNDNALDTITIDWDDFSFLEVLPPDPGFRVETTPVTQIKIGATDVVAAYLGTTPVPVTWP